MKFKAKIIVKLKENVKDSKGEAVCAVLKRISLDDEPKVRLGKFFELEISGDTEPLAKEKLNKIITDVLVNPVVETFDILEFEPVNPDFGGTKEKCQN